MTEMPFDPATVIVDDDDSEPSDAPTKTRKPRSDAGVKRGPRGGGTVKVTNTKLATQLADPLAKVAMGIGFTMPTVAAVLVARGEATAQALVDVAAGHPKMLKALGRVSKVGPGTELVQTGIMIVVAAQIDVGRIPPDHPLAIPTGVNDLWAKMHPQAAQQVTEMPNVNLVPPPGYGRTPAQGLTPNDPRHPMYGFAAGVGAASVA